MKQIDPNSDRSLRQQEGIRKWKAAGCKGTLCYCTGLGKTKTAIDIITQFRVKNPLHLIKIIVPTDNLKIQWEEKLAQAGLVFYIDVLIINSASKLKELDVDFLILDECHRVPADSFVNIFNICKPKLILGLTATFDRLDGKHEILNKHCPIVDIITVEEARQKGWVAEYKDYYVLLEVPDIQIYEQYNEQFLKHFAFFNYDFKLAMDCVKSNLVRDRYVRQITNNKPELYKDTMKACSAHAFCWNRALQNRKLFVQNHPKKMEIAKLILEKRPDAKAITFNASIAQCEKYKMGYVMHSGQTKKKNRLTLEEFNTLETGVIHSGKMLNEGADIQGVNLGIILYNTSSATERIQRIGRAIRKEGEKTSEIFSLVIKGTVEENWLKKSAKGLKGTYINEDQLLDVLNYKSINKKEETIKDSNYLFTF